MAEPKNNFGNFFNDPRPAMEKHKPKPPQVVEALMVITSQNHEWYKDSNLRMIVLMTMEKLAFDIKAEADGNDGKVDLPIHAAAFLMLLGDLAHATKQHASPVELERFHGEDEDEEDED